MQEIVIIRHGKAVDRADWTEDDWLRPLTSRGRKDFSYFLESIRPCLPNLNWIVTGFLKRGYQSAEIVTETLKAPAWEQFDCVAEDYHFETIWSQIFENRSGVGAIVGHNPALGLLINDLLEIESRTPIIDLKKGEVCHLKKNGTHYKLKALYSPKKTSQILATFQGKSH